MRRIVKILGEIVLIFSFSLSFTIISLFSQPLNKTSLEVSIETKSIGKFEYVPGEIIVKYKEGVSGEEVKTVSTSFLGVGAEIKGVIKPKKDRPIYLIKLPKGVEVKEAIKQIEKDPNVEYVEPNYIYHLLGLPNDPSFNLQWYLHNTGQVVNGLPCFPDADIDAPEAWNKTTGSSDVIIAVIDSGIDLNHPDLISNIWTNPGEIPDNGIDDDGNGYIDDIHGWDFFDNDNDPTDYNLHGTHVAGIIGAKGNNGQFISGVNWNVKIMPLRAGGVGILNTFATVNAIYYAVDNGAHVINASYGNTNFSQTEYNAWKYASDKGILCVAAAGNKENNNDTNHTYPACFGYAPACNGNSPITNIIAVAATDENDNLASYSNYGVNSVHVAAPGGNGLQLNFLSTVPEITEGNYELVYFQNFEGYNGTLPPDWNKGGINSTWICGWSYTYQTTFLEDSYWSNYQPNTSSWVGCINPISRVKDSKYWLNFVIKYDLELSLASLFIVGSADGNNWERIREGNFWILGNSVGSYITGSSGGNLYPCTFDNITFLADITDPFYFGFELESSPNAQGDDGVHIDDVALIRIPLTITGHTTKYKAGTSMAAPVVSGIAGLIKSVRPWADATIIKNIILSSVDQIQSLSDKVLTGGRVNAYKAVTYNTRPTKPQNFLPVNGAIVSLTPTLKSSSYSDPENDPHQATYWYIADSNFNKVWDKLTTTELTSIQIPSGVLQYESIYYWCVFHQDCFGEWSEQSNWTSFTTQEAPSDGGGGGGGGGCFIATVVFGSPVAKQIQILREFREKYLITTPLGKRFVDWYYQKGPVAAKFIEKYFWIKPTVKICLYPLIFFAYLTIKKMILPVLLIVVAMWSLLIILHRKILQKQKKA